MYTYVMCDTTQLKKIDYNTVSKTFGTIPKSIVHEDNEACLKFAQIPKLSPRIAIPYHFFQLKVEEMEIKHFIGLHFVE